MANTRVATGLYLSKSCMSLAFVVVYGLMEWNMFSFVGRRREDREWFAGIGFVNIINLMNTSVLHAVRLNWKTV
jgi:hypothetical protein